jgi:hypothetical protein
MVISVAAALIWGTVSILRALLFANNIANLPTTSARLGYSSFLDYFKWLVGPAADAPAAARCRASRSDAGQNG